MQNSLKYAKFLEEAGLPRNVAEAHIEILTEIVGDEMATKADIFEIRTNFVKAHSDKTEMKTDVSQLKSDMVEVKTDVSQLKSDMVEVKADVSQLKSDMTEVKAEIFELKSDVADTKQSLKDLEQRFSYEMQAMEYRLVLKLGGVMAAFLATALTAAKLFLV